MPASKLREFLDGNGVKYRIVYHSPAFTAQEVAAKAGVSGNELAKTVMVRVDGRVAMAVLPASFRVDFRRLGAALNANRIDLMTEEDFKDMFPNCDTGAMPPFGNLYGMEVVMDEHLAGDEQIDFNAGSLNELLQMSTADYRRLVQPSVHAFAVRA